MNSSSVDDEIAEIEQSARIQAMILPQNQTNNSSSFNNSATSGAREKSIGSVDSFNSKDHMKGDLLVGFPNRFAPTSQMSAGSSHCVTGLSLASSGTGKAKQRNSVSLNPMDMRSALAGLSDLDDSDDDDEDNKAQVKKDRAPSPPQVVNPKASGGPDHRPLVGGFAAAAYEAARVDHYKKQGMDVRGHNAPKPRSHYPRYP